MRQLRNSGRERRRHHRYDVREVYGFLVFPMSVEVLNMSLTGLAVESRQPLAIGRKYDVELRNGSESIRLNADVQWCHLVRTEHEELDEVTPIYQAGLDFRHVLTEKARELLGFLEHNVVIDVERRIFGRFKLADEGVVGTSVRREFVVRELSFSGMLIETDVLPKVGSTFEMEVNPGERRIRTRGTVVHAQRLSKDSRCRAGIEFFAMPPATRHALEQVIGTLLE